MSKAVPFVAALLLLTPLSAGADPGPVCYTHGPHETTDSSPRVGATELEEAVKSAAAKLQYEFETHPEWDCTAAAGDTETTCLEDSPCAESVYIVFQERRGTFSYTIVTRHRGKHVNVNLNLAGEQTDELLATLEDDIAMVLSRPRDYAFGALEHRLARKRRLDTDDIPAQGEDIWTKKAKKAKILKGFALGTGLLGLGGAAATIATFVATHNAVDDLEQKQTEKIGSAEIDEAKKLFIGSRIALGVTLASVVTSTVLFGVWLRHRKSGPGDPEKIGPLSVVATPALHTAGGLLIIEGTF